MTETDGKTQEVTVNSGGVSLKGDVVDDIRPVVKRGADITDSILRLLGNAICLPADYISTHLEKFRQRYTDKFNEIPKELRQEPPLRIGCSVLRHAAYSAEESDVQELFSNLLASASNKETVHDVHPGFATVINDLEPHEAKILAAMKKKERFRFSADERNISAISDEINVPAERVNSGIANLLRLGIFEWENMSPSSYIMEQIRNPLSPRGDPIEDMNKLKRSVSSALRALNKQDFIRLTAFGFRFLNTCLPKGP